MTKPLFLVLFALLATSTATPAQTNNVTPIDHSPLPKSAANPSLQPTPIAQRRIVEGYGNLPLSFEANQGQTDPRVKFLSRGAGYTLFLTGNEAVFSMRGSRATVKTSPASLHTQPDAVAATTNAVLRMKLLHASPAAKVTGTDELPGKSNYFIGSDPTKWHGNVPTYAKVKYGSIYPGIDLIYYGNQRQLEYDFVVAPGADPHRIQFDVRGARKITEDQNGDLVLHFPAGELRWHKPAVYQEKGGTRQTIDGHYVIKRRQRVGFELANYDSQRPLIIDPALAYSTYLGGATNYSSASSVAVDASGNAYLTGSTRSWDFPVTPGAFQTTCPSGQGEYGCGTWGAAFITKMNPTGTALVYSTYLGGNEGAGASAIAIDVAGNAYVTGQTYSSNFPTTSGAFQTTCNSCGYYQGLGDAFVTELNPTGSGLVYSTYLGGDTPNQYFNNSLGDGIAIDTSGDVYVAGYTNFGGFPVTPGAFQTKCGSCQVGPTLVNAFVTEFNPTLSILLYSTFLGGSNSDSASSMALDAAGDLYLTGSATSTNFPVTPGAFQTTCNSLCDDVFVTELNPTGSALIYSTYLGGNITQGSGQGGNGIALDASGDAYVTGETGASDFPTTPGAFQTTCLGCHGGGGNAFATEFNPTGSALVYSTYLGGSIVDISTGIALDTTGDVYLSGETFSIDFPTTPGAFQTCAACTIGMYRGFVSELNLTGSALIYSTYLTGSSGAGAARIALDATGGAYVVGSTSSTDFPVTPGAFQTTCAGGCNYSNAFVTKFVPGDQVWPLSLSFGNQPVGIGSNPQNTVLTNSDTTTLSITSIKFTGTNNGDFSETDDCGTSLATGASCNIAVTFTPPATGSRTASLTITDSAANSPQSVVLSGTGTVTVTVAPLSLNFGSQPLGTTSQPLPVMLSTNGTLNITSISTSAPFAQTNNCGTTLPPGGSCIINVTFTASALGLQNGTLTISDDGAGSPQTVALSGTGSLAVTLLPSTLNFSQAFGTTSQPMPVTLSTNGTLSISSISTAAPFAQTNNCGTGLAAGGSCTINVTFTPPALGLQNGTLTVTDDATGSPQTVALSGTGVTPINLAPTSLNFGNQTVGITSPALISTLTNLGIVSVTIASIVITGANSSVFAQMNNCPATIAPNGSCTISVTFTPTTLGSDSASVIVTDNAPGSPQTIALTGTGSGPVLALSPPSLTFPNQYVGTSGLPQSVTLTNTGSGPLTITNVATSPADFGPLNACGSSVAVGSSCSIGVFFDPTASGTRTGTLTITDNASGSPQIVPLSGTGQDFSMAPSGSSSATVSAGQTASYAIAVTPAGGFNQTVTFNCNGGPAGSACSVSPGSIKLNGSTPSTATVKVTTAGSSAGFTQPPAGLRGNDLFTLSLAFCGTLGLVLLIPLSGRRREANPRAIYGLALACVICMGLIVSGCGGGSSNSTGPGTYNVTVTGNFTSGTTTLTHTTKVTLVVQ